MAQARAFSNNTPTQNYTSDAQLATLKLPPHSIEAEQSLIGGLLLDNTAWDRIGDVVAEGDFYRDDHRRIFRHISRLIEVGRPADVLTVSESIANANETEQTGGMAYLAEIANIPAHLQLDVADEARTYNRHNRSGWFVSGGISAQEKLSGLWFGTSRQLVSA